MMKTHSYIFICIINILYSCGSSSDSSQNLQDSETQTTPQQLPFKKISLDNLDDFEQAGENWKVYGEVSSLFEEKHHLNTEKGAGVLASLPDNENNSSLITKIQHGDIELKLEYLCSKESNTQLLFQGRYGLQISDSWNQEDQTNPLNGEIFIQTKDESASESTQTAPLLTASRAPGLWQHLHILFRAPQFDNSGKKIKNAYIEYVLHNDVLIQEDVELLSPSFTELYQDESPTGPLMFLGGDGPIAFRNIQYKTYGNDSLKIENLKCSVYHGKWDFIPDFDTLKKIKEEVNVKAFENFDDLSGQSDHYALKYEGNLIVPTTGDYLIETIIDDGGDLKIDDQLVIHNQGEPGVGHEKALINLSEGTHKIKMTFYEEVWMSTLTIYYEGPEIERQTLASLDLEANNENTKKLKPLIIKPKDSYEVLRSFVNYKNEKRTHAISVGSPKGVHYSYDLLEGSLLKAWKGNFADVEEMWRGRGEPQLLKPLNAVIEPNAGIPLASLSQKTSTWPTETPDDFKYKGYKTRKDDCPLFIYEYNGISIEDHLEPNDAMQLIRKIKFKANQAQKNYWYKLANGKNIKKLENGWYSIDQLYYLKIIAHSDANEEIRSLDDKQYLLIPLLESDNTSEISLALLW